MSNDMSYLKYETQLLDIKSLNTISLHSLIDLYKQGYKIEELNDKYNNIYNIKSLATCPTSIIQGTTISNITLSSLNGTPPYTYHWTIIKPDNSIETLGNQPSVSYTFSQLGKYKINAYVTDSCLTGSLQGNIESCTINVIQTTLSPCTGCDLTVNYCLANTCIPKKYILYSGIGLGVLLLLLTNKK